MAAAARVIRNTRDVLLARRAFARSTHAPVFGSGTTLEYPFP